MGIWGGRRYIGQFAWFPSGTQKEGSLWGFKEKDERRKVRKLRGR